METAKTTDMELHGGLFLFCGKTAKALKLFDKEGKWDSAKLRKHVEGCEACKFGVGKVMGMMSSRSTKAKAAASRANGKLGGRPRTRPE